MCFPGHRPCRLRQSETFPRRETRLSVNDLMVSSFIFPGTQVRNL